MNFPGSTFERDWKDTDAENRVLSSVGIVKLPLYDAPDGKPALRYLVRGSAVEIIDASGNERYWLKVRFKNPKRGPTVGWMRSDEAGFSY